MKLRNIEILEPDKNKRGDLFCRLMGDLFHAIGYSEPRFNIHKSGREIDLNTIHRTEKKIAIAECKAQGDPIGGSDINKFIGVLDAENKKYNKNKDFKNFDVVGYFVSLSGFTETAIEQEEEADNERIILIKPDKIVEELIAGKILVPIENAINKINYIDSDLRLGEFADLVAFDQGWVWVIYFSNGQVITHFSLIHAEGNPLVKDLVEDIINIDRLTKNKFLKLTCIYPPPEDSDLSQKIEEVKVKYFKYIENECGEIQFEGLPTDKDAGAVKVKLENIFVPLFLEEINYGKEELRDFSERKREGIGEILHKRTKLAILAKPGGGKSTLIKRIAIAYAYPERRNLISDNLPDQNWFPIFLRCRDLGDLVTASITEIISKITSRAELLGCSDLFSVLISEALQKGSALLLIDGLDEIADDKQRIIFVNQLRTFIATYPNVNIIVTSREAGFRVVGGALANYCTHTKISNLVDSEIELLTIKWHQAIIDNTENTIKEAKSLAKLILKDKRIIVLARNPLLLTTLLFVKRWAGYLPTKKSILYQEMIKLLLVTWNVEGHEQLDIDEAEPQLAYVAYWMTKKMEQTITLDDLKIYLLEARVQMPDILGYSKISVPDFIKRVESRSSILIMTGHRKLPNGMITPIYEFLHLSFQEHLTARAIVEKYIPKKEAKKSILQLLRPHLENEYWKEVIPLVATLSKRETKELIEFLIEKSIIPNDYNMNKAKRNNKITPAELLGNCIANEIQIKPELLEKALEWYSKNRFYMSDRAALEIILNSKFGELLKNKVKKLFYEKYDDNFSLSLGGMLAEIYLFEIGTNVPKKAIMSISSDLKRGNKEQNCDAIFGLMEIAFLSRDVPDVEILALEDKENFNFIYIELLKYLKLNDMFYDMCISWALAWLGRRSLINENYLSNFVQILIGKWVNYTEYNLHRVISWALFINMHPSLDLNLFSNKQLNQEIILSRFKNPMNEFDAITSIFLGTHLGLEWQKSEIEPIFKEKAKKTHTDTSVLEYAEKLGINLKGVKVKDETLQ